MREMIDKYKLKSIFSPAVTGKTEYSTTEILFAIENQPTVEAIPIEWLEKQADEYIEFGLNRIANELRVIIDEWEKKNGDDFQ